MEKLGVFDLALLKGMMFKLFLLKAGACELSEPAMRRWKEIELAERKWVS